MIGGIVGTDEHSGGIATQGLALSSGQNSPCFGEDEICGGVIPSLDSVFEEQVTLPGRKIAQFHRTGTESSHIIALGICIEYDSGANFSVALVI